MDSPTDRFQGARTPPRHELNPLLNPLLADNMGRWAEVYFASPPEKREEAVLALLRELEAENSASKVPSEPQQAAPAIPAEIPVSGSESATTRGYRTNLQHCDACGHDNPSEQWFCGMCGTPLSGTAAKHIRMNEISHHQGVTNQPFQSRAYADPEYQKSIEPRPLPPIEEPTRDPYDLSPFQSLRRKELAAQLASQQSPANRNRYYIGIGAAVLILAMAYLAWLGSRGSQKAHQTPAPSPPSAVDTVHAPASANTAASSSSQADATRLPGIPAAHVSTRPNGPKSGSSAILAGGATSAERTPAPSSISSLQPAADNLNLQDSSGNGEEELATAQRYLNGTNGQPRDAGEAAKWLWKSIAKHNGPALLVLADLYLKGEGVIKNCDQARVLLDSAAQRRLVAAGERLRNLQAFGCQ